MQIDRKFPRGRAALSNDDGRFERFRRVAVDDGWDRDEELPPIRTEVSEERPRTVITRNTSPDVPFDRSINPYRGCEHGCIYCFARPSHAWLGLSPGLDFETRLIARPDAPRLLDAELRRRSYRCEVIAIGTNTDAYQPIERDRRVLRGGLEVLRRELSRPDYVPAPIAIGTNTDAYQPVERGRRAMAAILAVLAETRHPVTITTKGTLVEQDLGVLAGLAAEGLVSVGVSVTTLDRAVARAMEPRVPGPARRLQAIERLAAAGVPVRIMVSPVIPALTDHELEAILAAGAAAGATAASSIPLRLPREVAGLFREWVAEAFPDRAARIMGRVRELHGGRDYDPAWGRRMTGQGPWAALLRQRFRVACARLGLSETGPVLRTDLFRPPSRDSAQLSLF